MTDASADTAPKLSDVVGPAAFATSELRLRVVSSLVLAAIAIAAAWAGGPPFAFLWFVGGVWVALEWLDMTGAEPRRPLQAGAIAGLSVLCLALIAEFSAPTMVGLLLAAVLAVAVLARSRRGWAAGGMACAAVVGLVPIALRGVESLGFALMLWVFAVVWVTDVAAFFSGRALGGPKLWPSVSPKKTWSGFAGGLVGGTLAGSLVALLAAQVGTPAPAPTAAVALASALASLASQAGDLAESAMKRRFGVKDSGRLIPGHGGVMDRLDGFAAVMLLAGVALAGSGLGWRASAP